MPESTSAWRTLANVLTLLRLATAPALAGAILCEAWLLATGLFWLAVATDFADGTLARRHGQSSPLGGFLDHLTDALFCSVGLAALAQQGVVTALLPLGVLVAFTQYAWDSRVVQGKALRASWLGRWNGVAYYVMVAVPVIRNALGIGWPWDWLVQAMAWALVLTTCTSILDRVIASANGRGG
jgi:CDP-diacylglycerol--glycerol-3-phosphate 3-phosphatidyltransferase